MLGIGLGLLSQIIVVAFASPPVEREEPVVNGEFLERSLREAPQHENRIVPARFPQGWVETPEQRADGWVPRPEQVIGQLAQPRQAGRQSWADKEFLEGLNLKRH